MGTKKNFSSYCLKNGCKIKLKANNIGLRVLSGSGARIDTTTLNGKMIFGFFAVLAEFERDLIVERTKAGLTAARARGRKGSRPRKMDKATLTMVMAAITNPKSVASEVAMRLGVTTTTLYMYVNGDGSPKEVGTQLLRGAFLGCFGKMECLGLQCQDGPQSTLLKGNYKYNENFYKKGIFSFSGRMLL